MTWVFARWAGRLAVLPFAVGCTTTSTISRINGPEIEGDIVGGSRSSLVIEANGRREVIARSNIREIDYPGNVHAVIGGVVLGYGVLNIAAGLEDCQDGYGSSQAEASAFCVGLFTPAALGLGLLIWGLGVNIGAKKAERDQSMNVEAPPPYPGGWPGYPPPPATAAPPPTAAPAPAPAPPPPAPTSTTAEDPALSPAPPPAPTSTSTDTPPLE